MWCLFRMLPLLIGAQVEEGLQHWDCLRKLWNIVQICTAPQIKSDDIALLRVLIEDHHKLFKLLYPDASIIPKLHYMIHIPDEITRFLLCFLCYHTILKILKSLLYGDKYLQCA